ncbi:MAG: hypothetical protein GC156_16385 [Actinomycetales bacterium]|nr:hypothetical protein [Actinomycetales bacterium]
MVVSEAEKYRLLDSPEWAAFAERESSVAADIVKFEEELSEPPVGGTGDQQLFLAGLQQRWLLADYFRTIHAERVRIAISGPLHVRENYLHDDYAAEETVSAICAGHALVRSELGRDRTYPTRRDIFGEPVDVRFLTILLRIGDLLDMRAERACSLLEGAASPLPSSSQAHWDQYKRIVGRATSPTEISIVAACETAEEHRLLANWCRWLVEEVREAPQLLTTSLRHADWKPPRASTSGGDKTIAIDRSSSATYRPVDWRFVFDEAEIVRRLVRDVHGEGLGFLRELIQNSLDAIRTRALVSQSADTRFTNLLPPEFRAQFTVELRLHTKDESVYRLDVIDQGVGMTEEIIQNYFLQIGRSWY